MSSLPLMSEDDRLTPAAANRIAAQAASRLGERLRQLRVAAGMTQTDLAGDRFSKEYVSQIERGKTRPTPRDDRVARRAGSASTRLTSRTASRRTSAAASTRALARAERAARGAAERRGARGVRSAFAPAVLATGMPELEVRALSGEATARMREGEVREAIELLERARVLTESDGFSDLERADVLFRLGVARYKLSSIQTAIGLFDEALKLAERTRASVRPAPLEHPRVALALLPAPARPRGRARGRRARARARRGPERPADGGGHLLPGVDHRRPRGPLGARAHVRGAREGDLRGDLRPRQPRPAAEQPRRDQLPARPSRRGDHVPQGRVPASTSRSAATRRPRLRRERLAAGAPPHRRRSAGRGAGALRAPAAAGPRRATSTRSAMRSSCSAARCSSRTGSTRRKRRSGRRGGVRPAFVCEPPCRCVGRAGRSRGSPR